jgi:hypothetical protein
MNADIVQIHQTAGHGGLPANDQASLTVGDSKGAVDVSSGSQRYGWTMNGVAIEVVVKDGRTYVNGDWVLYVGKQNN